MARTILGVMLALGVTASTLAQIEPMAQSRTVHAFVTVPQCLGSDLDDAEAPDFGPFDESVTSVVICDLGDANGHAAQLSAIGADTLAASGSVSSMAAGSGPEIVQSVAMSTFSVTFALDAEVSFTLAGNLFVYADMVTASAGASVELESTAGESYLDLVLEPSPAGGPTSTSFDESGTLPPGEYILHASAASLIDHEVPPARWGNASFDLDFEVGLCPADIDDDGQVGFSDLLEILLHHGPCPGCPADIDGDDQVGFEDLLAVLSSWGPCP